MFHEEGRLGIAALAAKIPRKIQRLAAWCESEHSMDPYDIRW